MTSRDWKLTLASLLLLAGPGALAAPAGGALARAAPVRPPVPVIDWAPCGDEFPGVECAGAPVPLDYDDPYGPSIGIALARIPASDQAHRIGTLFLNPGGPGVSGVDFLLYGIPGYALPPFGPFLAEVLGGRFDVVAFDPRGVARSEPVRCFDTADELWSWYLPIPYFPWRRDQERQFFDDWRWFAGQCLGHGQRTLPHMSTADVVRDLDLLRQAVGDRRLTYLGLSYGSYIGETYANLFPDKVRALAIDGVLDPRLYAAGAHIVYDAVSGGRAFGEFLRLCDEAYAVDPSYCPLGGPEGAGARFDALASAIRARTDLVVGVDLTYDALVVSAFDAMYVPEYWAGRDGYAEWFALLYEQYVGDPAAAARATELGRSLRDRLAGVGREQEAYDNGFDAFFASTCADAEFPARFPVWSAVGELSKLGSEFGPFLWWYYAACATWPVTPDRHDGPWAARTSAPLLVVGNTFDPVTSYDAAVATSELLPRGRLLTYAGSGHTAFARSDCVRGHVVSYLLDGTLPAEGTVCPANPNPFLPAPLLRAARAAPLVGLPPPWRVKAGVPRP